MGLFDLFRRPKVEMPDGGVASDATLSLLQALASIGKTGRSSIPSDAEATSFYMDSFSEKMKLLKPKFPRTALEAIETLCIYNPDVSQHVDNVITMGNTGHFVEVKSGDKIITEKAAEVIAAAAKRLYKASAGVDGLVNALLAQLCRTGALSAELVVSKRLSDGLRDVVLVPVNSIYFVRNQKTYEIEAYQYVTNSITLGLNQSYVKLNPATYTYYALDTLEDSPYALPPIIAALGSVQIQQHMLKNLANVVRKVGLVGFFSLLIKNDKKPRPGESDEQYRARTQALADSAMAQLKSSYNEGIFVGLQGAHEVKHESIVADLRGFQDIMQIVEEQVFSGVKSDPAMHGRTYSSTETYAGVVYDKLLKKAGNPQRLVKRFLEQMYMVELTLKGIPADSVTVTFKPAKPMDALAEQNARAALFTNVMNEYKNGIISTVDVARKLGYDSVDDIATLEGVREAAAATQQRTVDGPPVQPGMPPTGKTGQPPQPGKPSAPSKPDDKKQPDKKSSDKKKLSYLSIVEVNSNGDITQDGKIHELRR